MFFGVIATAACVSQMLFVDWLIYVFSVCTLPWQQSVIGWNNALGTKICKRGKILRGNKLFENVIVFVKKKDICIKFGV